MVGYSATARETRRRFAADLERRAFAPGANEGNYVGVIETEVGPRRIEIWLPPAFPYRKPGVAPVEPAIQGRPHQGIDGMLCLWPDQGYGWEPSTSADELLDRAAEWFAHDEREDWSVHDYAPDLDRLFVKGHSLMVYDDDWPAKEGSFGRFVVWALTSTGRATLAGRPVGGSAARPDRNTEHRAVTRFLIGTTETQVGIWLRVKRAPRPRQTLGLLLDEFDAIRTGDTPVLRELIRKGHGGAKRDLYLAAIYPDPVKSDTERSFFVAAHLPTGTRLNQLDAIGVQAFESAPGDLASMRRRLPPKHAALANRSVAIFGCGSLGSSVALTLARSGVGRFGLFDSDLLRPGHVLRHAAPAIMVGARKVDALHQVLDFYSPEVRVSTVEGHAWELVSLASVLTEFDLVIDATATPPYSLFLGEVCREGRVPLLTTYAQHSAEIGVVRLYRPGQDPCPACYELDPWPGAIHPAIPAGGDDSFYETGCADPTTLAAASDIEAAGNAASRLALRLLSGEWDGRNQVLVVNRVFARAESPFDTEGIHFAANPPSPDCTVCVAL